MKNIKRFISLPIACLAAFSLVACGGEEHTHTYDTTTWKTDATKHWHEATCGCEDVYGDVAGHTDGNHDGVCDECGYTDATHEHTYAEAWSYDENGHWHAATCFHDVKDEVVAHTPDALGDCTVCGYHVSDPDVSTVKKAIALGVSQKSEVKMGAMSYDMGYGATNVTYEFRGEYTYINEDGKNKYYSLNEDGSVLGVIVGSYGSVEVDAYATEDNMKGPKMPDFAEMSTGFYGAEELVDILYEIAEENANKDLETSAEDGVYSFSFGYYEQNYGLYQISVEFTLDADTYAIATVELSSTRYEKANIVEKDAATDTEASTWKPAENAESYGTAVISVKQGDVDAIENPYDSEKVTVTDFAVTDYWGTEITEVSIDNGETSSALYLDKAVTPESGLIATAEVSFSGEGVTHGLYATEGILVKYDVNSPSYFTIEAITAGEYTLTVTVNDVSKNITVKVVKPTPTSIYVGTVRDVDYGMIYSYLEESSSYTIKTTESFTLGIGLDKGEGVTLTATPELSLTPVLSTSSYTMLDDQRYYPNITLYTCTLSGLKAGEYTITAKATDNAALTATFKLTVEEENTSGDDNTGSALTGTGVQTDPYIITASGNYEAVLSQELLENRGYIYYAYTADTDGDFVIEFTGTDYYYGYSTMNFMLISTYDHTTNKATIAVTKGQTVFLKVASYYGGANIPFTVTVPVASTDSGNSGATDGGLVVGTNSVEVTVEMYYCAGTMVTFTATEAGTYTISAAEGETHADLMAMAGYEWITLPYEFTLAAGESISFLVTTTDYMYESNTETIELVIAKK